MTSGKTAGGEVQSSNNSVDPRFEPPLPQIALFVRDDLTLARWMKLLSRECEVNPAPNEGALQALVEAEAVDAVVCDDWNPVLLRGLERRPRGFRVVHCAPTMPPEVTDAVERGYQVDHVDLPAQLLRCVVEMRRLAPSSPFPRTIIASMLRVEWTGAERSYPLIALSNGAFSFRVDESGEIDSLLPGTALRGVQIVRGHAIIVTGVTAHVRRVESIDDGSLDYCIRCELLEPRPGAVRVKVNHTTDKGRSISLLGDAIREDGILLELLDRPGFGFRCEGGIVD